MRSLHFIQLIVVVVKRWWFMITGTCSKEVGVQGIESFEREYHRLLDESARQKCRFVPWMGHCQEFRAAEAPCVRAQHDTSFIWTCAVCQKTPDSAADHL